MITKIIHLGGLDFEGRTVYTSVKPSRTDIIKDLNNWLFDYYHSRKEDVLFLPELDDWTHSEEDDSMWYIHFPTDSHFIWIRHEPVEFK